MNSILNYSQNISLDSDKNYNPDVSIHDNEVYFYCNVNPKTILDLQIKIKTAHAALLLKERNEDVQINSRPLNLYIYSYGGVCDSGLLMFDFIKSFVRPIHTHVSGTAASCGTIIAIAGKFRTITPSSTYLIHQLQGATWGSYQKIIDYKESSDKMMKTIINIYKNHSKIKDVQLQELLKRDLDLSAQEALKLGFVDKII